jgi:hypothetical protein
MMTKDEALFRITADLDDALELLETGRVDQARNLLCGLRNNTGRLFRESIDHSRARREKRSA